MLVTSQTLETLLSESVDSAREREARTFDDLAGSLRGSVILSGAGGLGRRCLAGLRHHGIKPLAFTDNNPKLWGRQVDGLTVLNPVDAAERWALEAVFVVTIWGALSRDRMVDRELHLRRLGCRHVVPFAPLFWKYPAHVLPHYAADLPHRLLVEKEDVRRGYEMWADEESRREYIAQVKWRLTFDFTDMAPPVRSEIYFPPDLVALTDREVFVDCGAFDGDTLALFVDKAKNFARVLAFEPDRANFEKLQESIQCLPDGLKSKVELRWAAVGAQRGKVNFSALGNPSSSVGGNGGEVDCVTLDEMLAAGDATFLKMDIEGAEMDALLGASAVIRKNSPILAISCYHRQNDLWAIPLLIRSLNPNYRFFLRPHDLEGWDLVCYAIPESRLPHRVRQP